MSVPSAPAPPADGRVSTGNPGLDAMLEGGLVARRPYLVVGPSGTGKTTAALQFLCEGVRRGERTLLVTLEEPPNEARINHRGFEPELDRVEVFDAIPDIMRYERVPFKDIASVRSAVQFSHVPLVIRRSPELSAVEVTMAALEQMLRTEVIRRGYSRIAIDSLTALQYFCMKGFDLVAGAQSFLRFLSDLRVTTVLTVESPLEDVETPERALARGEIRLFRWELENRSVRAVGVEKFRGSPHDVRLHPYRIGPRGIDIDLKTTISRDTRQIIEPARPAEPMAAPTPIPLEEVISPVDSLAEEVRDLVLVGAEIGPLRTEIEAALGAAAAGELDRSRGHLTRASALALGISVSFGQSRVDSARPPLEVAEAFQRINQRAEAARAGFPPTKLPPPKVLEVQLEWVLSLLPPAVEVPIPKAASTAETARGVPTFEVEPLATAPLTPAPLTPVIADAAPVSETSVPVSPSPTPEGVRVAVPTSRPEPGSITPMPAMPPAPVHDVALGTPVVVVPPALPTGHRQEIDAPAAQAPSASEAGRPSPGTLRPSRAEERPPLPKAHAPITSHERAAPPRVIRPLEVLRRVPIPTVSLPPPAAPPPPSPSAIHEPLATATPVAPKRRRRAATPTRKKTSPPASPTEPAAASFVPAATPGVTEAGALVEPVIALPAPVQESALPGPVLTTKPKKRTARKRKAPPVVAATAGTIPPAGVEGSAAVPPPSGSSDLSKDAA